MKQINLDFIPVNRKGEPHVIDYPVGQFLMQELDRRVNKERPELEASIADQLAVDNTFLIDDSAENNDLNYLYAIVQNLQIDNLLKGQILNEFTKA